MKDSKSILYWCTKPCMASRNWANTTKKGRTWIIGLLNI